MQDTPKDYLEGTHAEVTPNSSVVGSSIQIVHPEHRVVAMLAIMVPQPGIPYKPVAKALGTRFATLWNAAQVSLTAPLPASAALPLSDDDVMNIFAEESEPGAPEENTTLLGMTLKEGAYLFRDAKPALGNDGKPMIIGGVKVLVNEAVPKGFALLIHDGDAAPQKIAFCEDEGCPHHGELHICNTPLPEDKHPLIAVEVIGEPATPLRHTVRGNGLHDGMIHHYVHDGLMDLEVYHGYGESALRECHAVADALNLIGDEE